MITRKRASLFLAVVMIFCLAVSGCNQTSQPNASVSPTPSTSTPTPVSSSPPASTPTDPDQITAENFDWPPFLDQTPDEYTELFSGVLFKPDYMDRSGIDKGLVEGRVKDKIRVGYVAHTFSNAYFVMLNNGVEETCANYGYELITVPYEDDTARMITVVEDFVTQQVDAIILDPSDAFIGAQATAIAVAADIPVITVGPQLASDGAHLTSLHPQPSYTAQRAGYDMVMYREDLQNLDEELIGIYAAGDLGRRQVILGWMIGVYMARMELAGTPLDFYAAAEICTKYDETLYTTGSVFIEEANFSIPWIPHESGLDASTGVTIGEQILSAVPDVNMIYAQNESIGAGVIAAYEAAGVLVDVDTGILLGCNSDGSTQGVEQIRDRKSFCTHHTIPFIQAQIAVDLLHAVFSGEMTYEEANNMCGHTNVPIVRISLDNWEEFYDPESEFSKNPEGVSIEFRTVQQAFEEDILSTLG